MNYSDENGKIAKIWSLKYIPMSNKYIFNVNLSKWLMVIEQEAPLCSHCMCVFKHICENL